MKHRIVTSLLTLAAALPAADVVQLRSDRASQRAVLAQDELLVVGAAQVAPAGRVRIERMADRDATANRARTLLARGEATRVAPVLYLDGRLGDPNARAYATRQILIGVAPGGTVAEIARAHGVRIVEAVRGRPGWWLVEPESTALHAPLDAAAALAGDARLDLVHPLLEMPAARRYTPNDPVYAAGYMWHLVNAAPGIRVAEVWDDYKGFGSNIAISDDGVQTDHPDLNVRQTYSRDYVRNVADGNHKSPGDGHGTVVAGLAAAIGDNNIGVTGVAFQGRIIASRILQEFDPNAVGALTLPPDNRLRDAMTVQMVAPPLEMTWANNNSWGVPDSGSLMGGPGPLMLLGLQEGTVFGRAGRGIPYIWAAGNGGRLNPNDIQDVTAFDGYLNRFVIGVAALKHPQAFPPTPVVPLRKASYSESGPNITISAPGGEFGPPGAPWGIVSTDRTGDDGYVLSNGDSNDDGLLDSDFDVDNSVFATPPPNGPDPAYENGDYIPDNRQIVGTSFAAPIVAGCVTLMGEARPQLSYRDMRQLMMHRGQDVLPTQRDPGVGLHDSWAIWRSNDVNLQYNNWYGFGAVDMGRFIYGGNGQRADLGTAGARDEPGALRWPLLPPLMAEPLRYQGDYPRPSNDLNNPDIYAIFDAPPYPGTGDPDLEPDGRSVVGIGSRLCTVQMPIATMPDRFRVDSVELTVELEGLGPQSYPGGAATSPAVAGKPRFQGPTSGNGRFNWGDYHFSLTSPNGTTAILGRQRPGRLSYTSPALPGTPNLTERWTFTELFHVNETDVQGIWTLSIIDERNNVPQDPTADPAFFNPPQARVRSVDLKIWGHQTYATPTLSSTASSGVASGEGTQRLRITGDGFARSQGGDSVTQAYWQALDLAGNPVGSPVEIGTRFSSTTVQDVEIPASLLPEDSPGQGRLFIANPAVVVGRTGTGAGATDAFDGPNTLLGTTVSTPTTGTITVDRRMKRCPPTDDKIIRYSRRPTLTPIPDISLNNGGTFTVSTVAYDPDVVASLPAAPGTPETLTVTVTSFNPFFLPSGNIIVTEPGGNGVGTYAIQCTPATTSSGFALVQVQVTDGVLTTTRSFRVIIPSDDDASGCGGGMGLALLGVPLAAWLIRRRRRG